MILGFFNVSRLFIYFWDLATIALGRLCNVVDVLFLALHQNGPLMATGFLCYMVAVVVAYKQRSLVIQIGNQLSIVIKFRIINFFKTWKNRFNDGKILLSKVRGWKKTNVLFILYELVFFFFTSCKYVIAGLIRIFIYFLRYVARGYFGS